MTEILRSELLTAAGFRHAFFTRAGGVSTGPYASLSFSVAVGDAPEAVAGNIERAARELGVSKEHVYFLSQVHGKEVVEIDGRSPREEVLRLEADALVSSNPEIACGVRSADCVPILLGDPRSGAVGAVHAGWRGVVRGVVEAAVLALRRRAAGEGRLLAAIGPHIRQDAFEVSEDVAVELERASPVAGAVRRGAGKPHVSLATIVRAQLLSSGLAVSDVDDVGGCTASEPARFFSFRRDGRVGGRHLSAIVALSGQPRA